MMIESLTSENLCRKRVVRSETALEGGAEGALSTSPLGIWGFRKKRKRIYIFEVKFDYLDLKSQLGLCKVGVLLADLFLVGGNV